MVQAAPDAWPSWKVTRIRTESLRTTVSVSGKRGFAGRDKGARKALKIQMVFCRDEVHTQNATNSGQFARSREISVSTRVRGGAGRTRTFSQAVMSEPLRLQKSEFFRPTKVTLPTLTFDWTCGPRRACMQNKQDCRDLGVHAREPGFARA